MTKHDPAAEQPGDRQPATPLEHLAAANPAVLAASLASATGEVARGLGYARAVTHTLGPAGMEPQLTEPELTALRGWAAEVLQAPAPARRSPTAIDDESFAEFAGAIAG